MILLQSVVSLFASPNGYAKSSVQAAIAASTGTFVSVWTSGDGYGYGITAVEVSDTDGEEDLMDATGGRGSIGDGGDTDKRKGSDYLRLKSQSTFWCGLFLEISTRF